MNMKPILFNTEMVRATLDNRKTVTRRVVKPQPRAIYHDGKIYEDDGLYVIAENQNGGLEQIELQYSPGDILYVKETWYYESHMEDMTAGEPDLPSGAYSHRYIFKADCPDYPVDVGVGRHGWQPSIHMPKEAARLFLRVTGVLVERLQDISDDEALKEGCGIWGDVDWIRFPREDFSRVWNSTIKPKDRARYGWAANPWAWVIEFERISREEAKT